MLNLQSEVYTQQSLTDLRKFNYFITGLNRKYEVIEVDTRNNICSKVSSFMDQQYQYPQINEAKYLQTQFGKSYFFSLNNKIVSMQGQNVQETNSKADFVKGLDGKGSTFIFGKFHKNHQKYSLNIFRVGRQKNIVKLFDKKFNKISLIQSSDCFHGLVQTCDNQIYLQYGSNWQKCQQLSTAGTYQMDSSFVYLISEVSKKQNKNKFEEQLSLLQTHSKIKIQAFDKNKINKGKGYSQFDLNLPRYPIKIDSFNTDLIIAFDNSLQFYDMRKTIKPFIKEARSQISDFLYEPNLQKIYLSCEKGLYIYDYK